MSLILPPFPQPFNQAIHPSFLIDDLNPYIPQNAFDSHPLEKAVRDYADRFELYSDQEQRLRLANCHCAWLGALIYPKGTEELLQIGIDFCMWSIAYDDEYCDEGEIASQPEKLIQYSAEIWRQFESPEYKLSNDRYAQAARDLRIRLDKYAKPEQVARFVEQMKVYMMAEMWKSVNPTPSLTDYISMRYGTFLYPTLGHIIADVDIATKDYENRKVRALFEILSSLTVWETEPHAYLKELNRGANDKNHNLIRVLMSERGYSFEDAMQEYLKIRERTFGLFFRLKNEVEKEAPKGVSAYIESIIRYYVGGITWSQNTKRYKSISGNSDAGIFQGGMMTDALPESLFTETEPLDFDAVKWWWNYDPLCV